MSHSRYEHPLILESGAESHRSQISLNPFEEKTLGDAFKNHKSVSKHTSKQASLDIPRNITRKVKSSTLVDHSKIEGPEFECFMC